MIGLLDYALRYASLGWHCLPVNARTKKPLIDRWNERASTDAKQLEDWFADGKAGIAIACNASGLVVLDLDIKPGANGQQWLEVCESLYGDVPEGPVAVTPSGGKHLVFRCPPGLDHPPHLTSGRLAPAVDLIGNGYFLCEPTGGVRGDYEWIDGQDPLTANLPLLPNWIVDVYGEKASGGYSAATGRTYRRGEVAPSLVSESRLVEATAALEHLDPSCGRDAWIKLGMALHSATGGGERGYLIWDEWSSKSSKYPGQAETLSQWQSFDPWGDVTIDTLFGWATGKRPAALVDSPFDPDAWAKERSKALAAELGHADFSFEVDAAHEEIKTALGALEEQEHAAYYLEPEWTSFEDLVAWEPPPLKWVAEGLILEEQLTLLTGDPKTWKTWAGIELALSVAEAEPAFGRFPVRQARQVCCVFAEEPDRQVRKRVMALAKGKGCDIPPRHMVTTMRGHVVNLGESLSLALLVAHVRRRHPDGLDLLYLDPLRDLHTAEENSSTEMRPVMSGLRALRDVLGCALCVVHHTGKGATGKGSARGSSAIWGSVDGQIRMSSVEAAGEIDAHNLVSVTLRAAGEKEFKLALEVEDDPETLQAVAARWRNLDTEGGYHKLSKQMRREAYLEAMERLCATDKGSAVTASSIMKEAAVRDMPMAVNSLLKATESVSYAKRNGRNVFWLEQ